MSISLQSLNGSYFTWAMTLTTVAYSIAFAVNVFGTLPMGLVDIQYNKQ